jgi:hypothetical protein
VNQTLNRRIAFRLLALVLIAVSTSLLVMRGWPVFGDTFLRMAVPNVPETTMVK